jgi:hypothetical protein
VQQPLALCGHPRGGLGIIEGKADFGRLPELFQDVNDVYNHDHTDPLGLSCLLDIIDIIGNSVYSVYAELQHVEKQTSRFFSRDRVNAGRV